jgi:hypothetical protein
MLVGAKVLVTPDGKPLTEKETAASKDAMGTVTKET